MTLSLFPSDESLSLSFISVHLCLPTSDALSLPSKDQPLGQPAEEEGYLVMPRKKFLEDIGAAIRGSIDGVTAFRKGDDDGSVKFTVACSGMPDKHLQVVAMISGMN